MLTQREKECLKYLLQDLKIREIAARMVVEDGSIRMMFSSIRKKFAVQTNNGLISTIYQMGLDNLL